MTSKSAGQRSRSAKQSMTESFAAFGDRDTYLAITGRGDAAKTVLVPGRPGFIYVRLPKSVVTGTLEEYTETQAFSQNEYRHGVPVTVQKAEDNPSRYEVVDTWTVGMGEAVMQAVTTNVSHHRTSHEVYGTVGGHDPVMLHSVQIRNLQVTPTSPPSSKVVIGAGWYIYKHRGINWFDGVELDMADKVPTGTLSHNYVSLWLDPVTDQIVTRENANLALASFKKPLSDLVEWPVEDFIPLAAVRLSADNYVVRWQADGEPNIIDMRPHQAMMPGDMLPAGHPLDPIGGYHTGTLQSVHVTYDNASGSFAGDNVQDILTEIGAGGTGGTSGTISIEEDDLLVMGAVRLNFEGDDIYDLSVIDEGAGKATITGSFTGNLAAGGGFTEVGSRLTIDEYIHIRDERAQNTGGGDFISGAWRTRFLNTIVSDVGNHASLAGNQITLDAGTYMCHAFAGAHFVQGHQLRLQDIDNTLTLLLGASTYAEAVNTDTWMSVLHGVFTLTSPTTIELQHQCVTTRLVDGFGRPANITTEVHASIEFWKIDEQGVAGSTGTLQVEEDDFLVMGATTLNFEGDPIYDIGVIDEGAGKGTITGSFDASEVTHGDLNFLTADTHPIYALLAGRSGGQTLIGGTGSGDDLTLQSTSHATGGTVIVKGKGTQNNNLQEWQDSAGTVVAYIDSDADVLNVGAGIPPSARLELESSVNKFFVAHNTGPQRMSLTEAGIKEWLHITAATGLTGVNVPVGSTAAQLHVVSINSATTGLIVQGAASQSANLQEWQDSSGNVIHATGDGLTGSVFVVNEFGTDINFRVEGDTDQNLLFVNAGNDQVGVGTQSPGAKFGVLGDSSDTNIAQFTAPVSGLLQWRLVNNAAFNTANITGLEFRGNSSTQERGMVSLRSNFTDTTDATRTSRMQIIANVAGAFDEVASIGGDGLIFNERGLDIDFRVEGDTEPNLLFVDASTNRVGIGTSSPQESLQVVGGHIRLDNTKLVEFRNAADSNHASIRVDSSDTFSIAAVGTNGIAFENTSFGDMVRILNSGLVGIGDTTPDAQLDVQVGAAATVGLIVQGAASQSASLFQLLDSSGNIIHTSGDGLTGSEFVINEFGTDIDFRVEGDTQANMIIVDAGTNTMGIGGAIVSGKVLGVNGQTEIRGSVTTNPQLRLRNESYTSADSSGTVGIDFFFGNHGAVRIDAWKQTVNTTGLRFWTEVGFGVPVQSLEITPRGLVAFNAHSVLTNAVTTFDYKHNTTGTPAAGLGVATRYFAESSTTEDRELGRYVAEWVTVTDASRKARVSLTVYDTAEREGIRLEASGSAPMLGFFGSAAVARQTGYTTFTNLTTDRTLDADATTVGELADVLGTLIEDLKSLGLIAA